MKKEQQIKRSEMQLKYHYRAGIDNDALPFQWVELYEIVVIKCQLNMSFIYRSH